MLVEDSTRTRNPLTACLGKCAARQQRDSGRDQALSPEHAGLSPALCLSQLVVASMSASRYRQPRGINSSLSRFVPCIAPRYLTRRIGNSTMLAQRRRRIQGNPLTYFVLCICIPAPLSKGPLSLIALPITRVINSKP